MNPRIQKMSNEIEKTRIKIAELQARVAELETQKTDAENTEIIAIFRSADIPLTGLHAFVKAYREQVTAPAVYPAAEPTRTTTAFTYASDSTEEGRDEN